MPAYHLPDVTIVADAEMISAANMEAIEEAGLSFILGMKIPDFPYVGAQWRREHQDEQMPDGLVLTQPYQREGGRLRLRTRPTPRNTTPYPALTGRRRCGSARTGGCWPRAGRTTVEMWEAITGESWASLTGHRARINVLAWSPRRQHAVLRQLRRHHHPWPVHTAVRYRPPLPGPARQLPARPTPAGELRGTILPDARTRFVQRPVSLLSACLWRRRAIASGGRKMEQDTGSESDVQVDVQHVESRGFDGVESVINVITLAAGGVIGGLTAAIGESVWKGVCKIVRDLINKRKNKEDSQIGGRKERIMIVVVSGPPGERLKYSCEIQDERDVEKFATSVREVEAVDRSGSCGAEVHKRFDIIDGEWKES